MIPHQDINAELTQMGVLNPTDVTRFIPPRVHSEFAATYTNLIALINDQSAWMAAKMVAKQMDDMVDADNPIAVDLMKAIEKAPQNAMIAFMQVTTPQGVENVALFKIDGHEKKRY